MLTGTCLCGKIEYAFSGEPINFNICHCKMCQKFHGASSGPYVWFKKDDFKIVRGHKLEAQYESSDMAFRVFCSGCGSSLRYIYRADPETIFVCAGILNGDPKIRPSQHIFVKDKCVWQEIADDLPQAEDWFKKLD